MLKGNARAQHHLDALLKSEKIPHLLLFHGPSGVGKSLWARYFAYQLICKKTPISRKELVSWHHPDLMFHQVRGRLGVHSIDAMRQLQQDVVLSPYEAAFKVLIIEDAHQMQTAAAHALLKTLEEPAPYTVLILLTSYKELILPTIISRAHQVGFVPLTVEDVISVLKEDFNLDDDQSSKLAYFSEGNLEKAIRYKENIDDGYAHLELLEKSFRSWSYLSLNRWCKALDSFLEKKAQIIEKELKADDDLSALARADIEKKIQGIIFLEHTTWLEESLLAIVRSIKKKYQQDCLGVDNRWLALFEESLEVAEKARLGFQRGMKPSVCIEFVCLKLGWLKVCP